MDADWTTSPSARRVQQHVQDPRPAWLWSQDGLRLIWKNDAADLFLAKLKKSGVKRAAPAVPIKGQVARNIRLGSIGRTSLARIQFLAGDKPVSSTCATTPLLWQDGQPVLLVVGVDAIDEAVRAAVKAEGSAVEPPHVAEPFPVDAAPAAVELPKPIVSAASGAYERELADWQKAEAGEIEATLVEIGPGSAPAPETMAPNRLSRLVDRLALDDALYAPLSEADDHPPGDKHDTDTAPAQLFQVTGRGFLPSEMSEEHAEVGDAEADLAAVMELDGESATTEPNATEAEASEDDVNLQNMREALDEETPEPAAADLVERVSRYNFDELSRILNDRVSEPAQPAPPPPAPAAMAPQPSGALVSLGGETLVLNRLPLGILVFRDQQVLFANRAITEMVGYDSVEQLRTAGLSAVFPAAGPEGQEAGPVNHLVQRDGTLVPVTARLQSISWHGRPALMLSASATEVRTGHEGAVRAFAQDFANLSGDGFVETTRAGVISAITPRAATLLGQNGAVVGKSISNLVRPDDLVDLREYLERPARYAETARPSIAVRASNGKADMIFFTQGQAGVTSGYFGFVRARDAAPLRLAAPNGTDTGLLGRISRGVRRPLNTIIGFADLIRSRVDGTPDARYLEYAEDITTAGQEIAALVSELDDYARLRDGRYLAQRSSIELTLLLENCVLRIRQQAGNARVIVRNAISENLPRITADQASLEQAVLNLLASAIDQTPQGGAVVISAQFNDDGGISVHVRDSSTDSVDMAERFVVFRDGIGGDGRAIAPVRSSVGLALTRSLLAVNAFSLSVDPAGDRGMLFTLHIPGELVDQATTRTQY